MGNKRCGVCGGLALTFDDAVEYTGTDDVSVFCEKNGNRVCIRCASEINAMFAPKTKPGNDDDYGYKKRGIPQKLRWDVFKRDGFKCLKCGTHIDLHCDHIYPESLGGKLHISNLQTLCAKCNKSKGNRI